MNKGTEDFYNVNPGLKPLINGVVRRTAIANVLIYCEFFHGVISNVTVADSDRVKPILCWKLRQDWCKYCIPSPADSNYPRNLWQYQATDRRMLCSLLMSDPVREWRERIDDTILKLLLDDLYEFLGLTDEARPNRLESEARIDSCEDQLSVLSNYRLATCLPIVPRKRVNLNESDEFPRYEYSYGDLSYLVPLLHPDWQRLEQVAKDILEGRNTAIVKDKRATRSAMERGAWDGLECDLFRCM